MPELMELVRETSPLGFVVKMSLNALALFAASRLLKGVTVTHFSKALIVALVLAFLNATLGSALKFVTYPLRLITLGFFSFVIDALVIVLAARFLKGFQVDGFWRALLLAIVLSIFNSILYTIYF